MRLMMWRAIFAKPCPLVRLDGVARGVAVAPLWAVLASDPRRAQRLHIIRQLGPGRYCSPRHRVPYKSTDEGSKCVG